MAGFQKWWINLRLSELQSFNFATPNESEPLMHSAGRPLDTMERNTLRQGMLFIRPDTTARAVQHERTSASTSLPISSSETPKEIGRVVLHDLINLSLPN